MSLMRLARCSMIVVFGAVGVFIGFPTGRKVAGGGVKAVVRDLRVLWGGKGRYASIVLKELKNISKPRSKVFFKNKTSMYGQQMEFFLRLNIRLPFELWLGRVL